MLTFTPSILLRDVAKGRFGEAAMPWWAPVERQFRAGHALWFGKVALALQSKTPAQLCRACLPGEGPFSAIPNFQTTVGKVVSPLCGDEPTS